MYRYTRWDKPLAWNLDSIAFLGVITENDYLSLIVVKVPNEDALRVSLTGYQG